jgi:SAM-dependent methyltransferase
MSNSDRAWEQWGKQDPYYAVLTHPDYRLDMLDASRRQAFFDAGRLYLDYLIARIRQLHDPCYEPNRVLDFGCGVGRILVPLLARSSVQHVVGVDISPSMLAEAGRNCGTGHAARLDLVLSDDELTRVDGQFDLVHSCIVLQHIDVARGRGLFAALLERVAPGGYGVLQIHYGNDAHPATFGRESPIRRFAVSVATHLTSWYSAVHARLFSGKRAPDPSMRMHAYSLNELAFLMQRAGISDFHADFANHGGALCVTLFFRAPPQSITPAAAPTRSA